MTKKHYLRRRITAVEYDFYKRNIPTLVEQFPEVFNKRFPKPLKIGVHEDLLKLTNFNEQEISALLKVWVQRREYIFMCCSLGKRFNLEGEKVEQIAEIQLKWAISEVHKTKFPQRIVKWCQRYLKEFGRPGLICIPIKDRPNLEVKDDSPKD